MFLESCLKEEEDIPLRLKYLCSSFL